MENKIIIGTVQFGLNYGITNKTGIINEENISKIFDFCFKNNILYFDTAQDYGNSENIVSKYNNLYNNFKIITKANFKDKNIEETIFNSLNKFSIIECFMLHSFNDYYNKILMNILIKFKNLSKIKKIGISVYNVEEALKILYDNNIDVIQIPFNYLDKQWLSDKFQKGLKDTKKEIHVRSIFLQGLLLNIPYKYPNNISKKDFYNLENTIIKITNELNISKLELCIYFINSYDWINKILIGIEDYNQLLNNYNVFKKNIKLSEKDIIFINQNLKNINTLLINPSKWLYQ